MHAQRLDIATSVDNSSRMTHLDCLEAESIHRGGRANSDNRISGLAVA